MPTNIFQKCYSVLGVFPDDDWETVRTAYKRQIRRWHPDKYQDPEQRNIAELKSRELNQAFQQLDEYYRENGVLPFNEVGAEATSATIQTPAAPAKTEETSPPASAFRAPDRSGRWHTKLILLAVLLVGSHLLLESQNEDEHGNLFATRLVNSGNPDVVSSSLERPTVSTDVVNHEDYMAQPEDELALSGKLLLPEPDDALIIRIGSTKKQVLAIQGAPFRQSGTSWEYGLSRIDFRNGRVVGWQENPMNPLRVAH